MTGHTPLRRSTEPACDGVVTPGAAGSDGRTELSFPTTDRTTLEAVRRTDGGDAIPADALAYLAATPRCDTESMERTWEESMHYGWGIGHPDHPVGDTIRDLVPVDEIWASTAAHRALYADQYAAADWTFADLEASWW